ncbi:MAG: DUF4124 domain-containing protein [Gammaproteobacteria bacterium]|nr:DUF4124 domain-containing protein [Gammaproteobacteria bacterium]
MRHAPVILASLIWGSLLAGLHPGRTARADTVWQWTDARGQTHFSDTPPVETARPGRQIRFADQATGAASGLRPGEQEALHRMERRRARQQQRALDMRQRNDHAVAAHRASCRANRDKLRSTRDREQRKLSISYLSKHCW